MLSFWIKTKQEAGRRCVGGIDLLSSPLLSSASYCACVFFPSSFGWLTRIARVSASDTELPLCCWPLSLFLPLAFSLLILLLLLLLLPRSLPPFPASSHAHTRTHSFIHSHPKTSSPPPIPLHFVFCFFPPPPPPPSPSAYPFLDRGSKYGFW